MNVSPWTIVFGVLFVVTVLILIVTLLRFKYFKKQAYAVARVAGERQDALDTSAKELQRARKAATTFHDKACDNGDDWMNHTTIKPEGYTKADRQRDEENAARIRKQRETVAENNRRSAEARRNKAEGYTTTDNTWVPLAVIASSSYSDSGYSSSDSGSSGGSWSSSDSSSSSSSSDGGGGGGGGE